MALVPWNQLVGSFGSDDTTDDDVPSDPWGSVDPSRALDPGGVSAALYSLSSPPPVPQRQTTAAPSQAPSQIIWAPIPGGQKQQPAPVQQAGMFGGFSPGLLLLGGGAIALVAVLLARKNKGS